MDEKKVTFLISLFDRCYWIAGSVLGAVMGQLIAFDTIGFVTALLSLALLGLENFLLPALATLFARALPFVVFGGKKGVPETVKYLGKVLPCAIMAILVVYCLKDIQLFSGNHGLPELLSVALVAGLHLWKKNTLLSIGTGIVFYMLLVQVIFV